MSSSLREKKREMLYSAIEHAAVALVLEHGYQNVTVDMICEASMASQRTFFNYFGSKEAVILGPPPPDPDPAIVSAFIHHPEGDVLSDLTRMMTRILDQHGDVDVQLWKDRRKIIRQDTDLMRAQAERIAAKDNQLTEMVKQRLEVKQHLKNDQSNDNFSTTIGTDPDHPAERAAADDLDREARLIVNIWWGITRYAMHEYAEHPGRTPQQITDDLLTVLARIKEA
jgi:AcrR family transcriptional regulator